ncbi:hypothetical protein Q1695_011184 [Nippostrongylus brasiliensis]|nr:hypothetical protein Q1695_011184 [Nippostrongylus brasiliensis]
MTPSTAGCVKVATIGPTPKSDIEEAETATCLSKPEMKAPVSSVPKPNSSGPRDYRFNDCRIYVSNIPFSFRSADLIKLFSPFGKVSDAEIVMNERGSKGFGFVTLDSKESSEAARTALNGSVVQGRVIEVKKATAMPYLRRNSAPPPALFPSPPFLSSNLLLPPPGPVFHNILPYSAQNHADPLAAVVLLQNQSRLPNLVNPIGPGQQLPALLIPRQLHGPQNVGVMAGGVQLSPIAVAPIPVPLLYAPPSSTIEPLPGTNPLPAMIPASSAGLSFTGVPPPAPGQFLISPPVHCHFSKDVPVANDQNPQKTEPLLLPPIGFDVLGSLGLGTGINPSIPPPTSLLREPPATNSLRSLDQSCVVDTSFHGEPLEGQFGPIGRAVPSSVSTGIVSQESNSTNDNIHNTSSSSIELKFANPLSPNVENIPNHFPVYQHFAPTIDRNGRKRLSSLDSYHLNRKLAKST